MDFETKLAAAGDVLEKLAAERGLTVNDFTEQEVGDLLTQIMGEKTASDDDETYYEEEKVASYYEDPQLTYGEVMSEVVKVAAANGYDINQASPAELDEAVQKMAELLTSPGYFEKQAALNEKVAEADAMGRIMAHAYVDELSKLAAAECADCCEKCGKDPCVCDKAEKKASLYAAVQGEESDYTKAASARAAEYLIENGINPATGEKFASDQEAVDAGATLILQHKGYL